MTDDDRPRTRERTADRTPRADRTLRAIAPAKRGIAPIATLAIVATLLVGAFAALGIAPLFAGGTPADLPHAHAQGGNNSSAFGIGLSRNVSTGLVGQPVAFHVNARPWGAQYTLSVQFGDGSSANASSFNASTVSLTHTYNRSGTYWVNATATDSSGARANSSMSFSVVTSLPPPPLTLAVVTTPISGSAPLFVTLTANATVSSGAGNVTLVFYFGNGLTARAGGFANPSYVVSENTTYNANGNYTATVLAVSLVGNASTQIGITVSGGNTSRGWLNAYASPTYGSAPLNVTFWGNDSAGIAPTWSFGAGNATNSTTAVGWVVSFVYTSPGLYLATATVNASGTPLVWSTWINVTSATPPPPPPPPAPNVTGILIAAAVGIGGNPLAVQFVVIGSMNWSELANASWTFGDGASATGAFLNYTYPGAGFYQVNVSVSIGGGHADTASVWLAVGSGGSSGNGSNGSGSGGGSGGSGGNGGGSGGPGGNGSGNQSGNNSGGNTSNPRDPHTSGGPGTSVNDAGYAIAGLGPLGSVLVYLGLGICAGLVGTHLIRERRKGGRPN